LVKEKHAKLKTRNEKAIKSLELDVARGAVEIIYDKDNGLRILKDGKEVSDSAIENLIMEFDIRTPEEFLSKFKELRDAPYLLGDNFVAEENQMLDVVSAKDFQLSIGEPTSALYKVEIFGDRKIEDVNLLDWYESVTQEQYDAITANGLIKQYFGHANITQNSTGKSVYEELRSIHRGSRTLVEAAKEASLYLSRVGIEGIKYPSNSLSGNANYDKMNYVVFDAKNIRKVEVLEKYSLDISKESATKDKIDVKQDKAHQGESKYDSIFNGTMESQLSNLQQALENDKEFNYGKELFNHKMRNAEFKDKSTQEGVTQEMYEDYIADFSEQAGMLRQSGFELDDRTVLDATTGNGRDNEQSAINENRRSSENKEVKARKQYLLPGVKSNITLSRHPLLDLHEKIAGKGYVDFNNHQFNNLNEIAQAYQFIRNKKSENSVIVMLDSSGKQVYSSIMSSGMPASVSIEPQKPNHAASYHRRLKKVISDRDVRAYSIYSQPPLWSN
jgi:hypothetical protein